MNPEAPVVVFIGQPNSGKSTLFNSLAGPRAETSNFPGTSFRHTHSTVRVGERLLNIVDLPGTYSLSPSEPAEKVVLTHLFTEKPDLVINVVDASILGRSLELTIELLELGYPMVLALNMIDLAERKGIAIDSGKLEDTLGVRVVPTIASQGRGTRELLDAVFDCLDRACPASSLRWSRDVEDEVNRLAERIPASFPVVGNRRFTAVKLIESGLPAASASAEQLPAGLEDEVRKVQESLQARRGIPAYEVIAAERHHLAMKIFEKCSRVRRAARPGWDRRLDAVLMHPILGYFILVGIFLLFFFLIFQIGSPLESLLLGPFAKLRASLAGLFGSGVVFHLLDGLIQGIGGGVAIVMPYFLPLLFFMAFLEDLGYLARAGFLLDAFMHRIGLHGKSVSPFILGFGCNVPAILSTRILESSRDRLITSILIPFIPCSARTTIILALVAFYLGPAWALGFYFLNILIVGGIGRLLTLFLKSPSPGLILEIPSLKMPSLKAMAEKTFVEFKSFVKFAWPLLVGGSMVLSLLHYLNLDRALNAAFSPLIVHALGLPRELGITLVFGFLRKELALIMMLQALGVDYQALMTAVTREQVLVFTVFISFFIPCLSTFAILWKEIGKKAAFLSAGLSILVAVVAGMLVRLIL